MDCRDQEGWVVVSRQRAFDVTPCFEEGILFSSLLAALLVISLVRSLTLAILDTRHISSPSRWILRLKLALLFGALFASAFNLAKILLLHVGVPVLASFFLEPIAIFASIFLTYFNHTRRRRSSTTLLLFWPTFALAIGIWIRTRVNIGLDPYFSILVTKVVVGALGLLSFLLECIGPEYHCEPQLGEKTTQESPVLTANIFSIWAFSWMTPLMKKGVKQYITEQDLPALVPSDESHKLGDDLEKALSKHALWKALFIAYGKPYAEAAGLKVLQDLLAFSQPQFLRILLAYISLYQNYRRTSLDRPSELEGFAIAVIMFFASIVQTICLNQYFQRTFETGMRVRAGLVSVIYKKALILSNDERGRASGDIVNLMSVDATRLQDLCTYGLIAISGPLQIIIAFVSLYNLLGWSAFVGVGIMIFSIPLNTQIARVLKRMQEAQMKNRDKRTRLMSELLANIKSIKLYAWEYSFLRRILEVRNEQELKMLRRIGIVTAGNTALWSGIPLLVAFASFATAATVSSRPLTSDIIFPAISLFMLLQFPLAMFSQVTSNIIEAAVSVKRLDSFLSAAELQTDAVEYVPTSSLQEGDTVLSIEGGEFSWDKEDVKSTLEDINLTVKKGQLVGVLGRVGAGKTSLLSAIIGDMNRREGSVSVKGTVAYAPQNPWIMSATIRENILFSHEYDETFYNLVIEACALLPDLALLADGDMTEVGEKGITLSGGQRARLSLARAVYSRADLVLLDDCLAAVDSHVARHVFDNVIGPHGILASKARILVTNSITFVRQFDSMIYLRRGIVLESGSYQELVANEESEISKLIRGHGTSGTSSGSSTPARTSGTLTPKVNEELQEVDDKSSVIISEKLRQQVTFSRPRLIQPTLAQLTIGKGLSTEHQERGRVKGGVYKEYIKAASVTGFGLFLLAVVGQQATSVMSTFALRYWGEHNREQGSNEGMTTYLVVYGLFSLSSCLLGGLSSVMIWVYCALRSAKRLHDLMLDALIKAPLSFFELTPTGRVLNLFSRDVYVTDQILGRVIQNFCRTSAVCLFILVVIGSSFPPFLAAVIPLGWFYMKVMQYYLATSRELERLDAVSRSPIFAWFSESLAGLSTIRAFHQQPIFIQHNQYRIDRNQICYLPSISVNRWLAVRLELVGALIILCVSTLAMTALVTSGVDAGLVGLVLSYALNTTSSLNWLVRSASEVEQNIVSVERILHQTEIKPEAPHEIPEAKPTTRWPSEGVVEFRDYSTRYRPELDLILKNVSIKSKPCEKIGVCGRTGAGKSSLLLALFRIIEPSNGTIFIDGVDITKIGLHDLRSSISIVPQTPDLFEGTLRDNIDPLNAYTDHEIWVALDQAHLKEYVDSLPEKLESPVREGGSSLSSGQRQLLCFARALLRKRRVLVLDEATSAVDLDTDLAIQEIIRGPAFDKVTIFTIAHRLNTIMSSDRVLVMDAGAVAEFESPDNLLKDKNSRFYALASEAGLVTETVDQ
uniref:YCF1 n=1 Tax=Agaricus brasiliensis TaxID=307931 RepID=A0A9E7V399_9AGAR|nr:YCF1 [Agaricus brasiliensis]